MARVVRLLDVQAAGPVLPREIEKMAEVLRRQGQIEPLQVRRDPGGLKIFEQDVHGHAIWWAAAKLGWNTLLIVEMKKFEA